MGPDGTPKATPSRPVGGGRAKAAPGKRGNPISWIKEVRAELRRVAWPTREEVQRYSLVVLFMLISLILVIFGLDYVFSQAAIFLFE